MTAAIYQLSRGYEIWTWLCEKHLKAKRAEGFEVKEKREPKHELKCDACKRSERTTGE